MFKFNPRKKYVIRAINPHTGAYMYSRTNDVEGRIELLREGVKLINSNDTNSHERFEPFKGCDPNEVLFEVYEQLIKIK
jgi:hypothetical protein